MFKIDDSMLGRKYYTMDPKTRYTIRGFALNGTLLVIGEYADDPNNVNTEHRIASHKLTEIHLVQ
jgi:hypothetical protein